MEYKTTSAEQTQKIAAKLAKKFINTGGVIALIGNLGAGKTTFTQGFAKALGIKDKIISPTFVVTRQHQFEDERFLFHIDLYRLETVDIRSLGIEEFIALPGSIVLVEWPEKILNQLPKNTIKIEIEKTGETERTIRIN